MSVRPIRINITTKKRDLLSALAGRMAEQDDEYDVEGILSELVDDSPCTYETPGLITRENGNIKLMYDESTVVTDNRDYVQIVFRERDPRTVSLFHGGELATALVFSSEHKRQVCLYRKDTFQLEIIVCTDEFSNTVTYDKGGRISIKYFIEFKGVRSEYGSIDIKAEPIGKIV